MTTPPPLGPDALPDLSRGARAIHGSPLDRVVPALVAVLIVYATATSVWEASRRAFWFDEVFTVVLSEKPAFSEIMTALRAAADTSGPGFYAMQRAFRVTARDPHVAHRAASIAAASLAMLAIFAFAWRELGALPAAVTVFFLLGTELNHGYSIEARAYAPMVLGVSLALLAWQRADRWPWALALLAAVVFSVSVHYYSVFALVPLGAAELARTLRTREMRWRVWVALGSGAATLLALWPLLQAQRSFYGTNFFSRPSIGKVLESYDILSGLGVNGAGLALAVTIGAACLMLLRRAWAAGWAGGSGARPETVVLVLGLIGLPFVIAIVTRVMGGGYTYRYAIAVLPGLALGTALLLKGISRRYSAWLLFILVAAFAAQELVFWGSGGVAGALRRPPPLKDRTALLARIDALELPVVVDDPHDYVPLAYYMRDRQVNLVGVLEQQLALRRTGTDSVELDVLVLSRYMRLDLEHFSDFCRTADRFLLLTRAGGSDWKSDELLERGFVLTTTYRERPFTLYTVTAPPTGDRTAICELDFAGK